MQRDGKAASMTDERFLEMLAVDPSWCVFYHRDRVVSVLPRLVDGRRCSERIRELENELADVRSEFESAGRSYIRDVQAREREIVRLKHLLTEAGVSWNP